MYVFRQSCSYDSVALTPEQQSIITTPYPQGLQKEEYLSSHVYRNNGKDLLTLVIYSSQASNRLAKVKQIALPAPKDIVVVDDSDPKKPQIRATIRYASLSTILLNLT